MIHGRELFPLWLAVGLLAPTLASMLPIFMGASLLWVLLFFGVVQFLFALFMLTLRRAVWVLWGDTYYVPIWQWRRYWINIQGYQVMKDIRWRNGENARPR